MSELLRSAPVAPLRYRVRPPQILLGVGAVLLVTAGAAAVSASGGQPARALLMVLAIGAAHYALRSAASDLHGSAETLAASAAGLALVSISSTGPFLPGEPGRAAVLAAVFLVLHLSSRGPAAWPLAAWGAGQLAVLGTLDDVPEALHTPACVVVAWVGLGIAVFGRPLVGRIALVTAAPWWVAGLVTGTWSAWTDPGALPWLSALLVLTTAAALLPVRLRRPLDPLLGPPRAVPVVVGAVSGVAAVGPFAALDPVALAVTGAVGVLLATGPASALTGWWRGLLAPAAGAAGTVVCGLCIALLAAAGRWAALSLLLLLTALLILLVAGRRLVERSVALPTVVGCLTASVLLALPGRFLLPALAAALLTSLYVVAMAVGPALDPGSRGGTARAAALAGAAAVVLLAADGGRLQLVAHLAVQGVVTLGWAWRTGAVSLPLPGDATVSSIAERLGAVQLVLAAWVSAAAADARHVEWYTVSAAIGLLIASGRRLRYGPSWPAWGPALLMAAVPSAALAVVAADAGRAGWVLVAAAVAMVVAPLAELRAPLLVGAVTVLWIAAGFAVRALPWPLATGLVVGTVLLALGRRGERRPIAGFGARLADLR